MTRISERDVVGRLTVMYIRLRFPLTTAPSIEWLSSYISANGTMLPLKLEKQMWSRPRNSPRTLLASLLRGRTISIYSASKSRFRFVSQYLHSRWRCPRTDGPWNTTHVRYQRKVEFGNREDVRRHVSHRRETCREIYRFILTPEWSIIVNLCYSVVILVLPCMLANLADLYRNISRKRIWFLRRFSCMTSRGNRRNDCLREK